MSNWISQWNTEESINLLKNVSGLLSTLGGPLTKDLDRLIQEDKFVDLVNYQFDYKSVTTVRDYTLARQVHALLRKQEWMNLGIDVRSVAESKFWEMEERCRETNTRLGSNQLNAETWAVVVMARKVIKRILGEVPSLDKLKFSFGPGATANVKGVIASPRAKLDACLSCSRESFPHVGDLLAQVPFWTLHHSGERDEERSYSAQAEGSYSYPTAVDVAVHPGKLTFVRKDARSDRPIIVEPTLNGFAQKGIGSYIKDRMLRCVGIDLTDQTRNQGLAYVGSVEGRLATVDMSSASDTVSLAVVEKLLPMEWFDFLLSWTTGEVGVIDGSRELHNFSSMGNGFTFELESLIFYALAWCCNQKLESNSEVSVFGDDVILDVRAFPLFAGVLSELGFLVNNEKSYFDGPFRESCGADWLDGNSIQPFYWRKPMSERTLYTFHNFAMRNGERELADLLHSYTRPDLRLYGPDGYGDGHMIGSYTLRSNRRLKRSGYEGGFFDTYALRPKRLKKRYDADWVYPSYSVYTRSGERDLTDPDIVRGSDGYAKVSIYTLARSVWNRNLAVSAESLGFQDLSYSKEERLFSIRLLNRRLGYLGK
jgi:hypothetical protein